MFIEFTSMEYAERDVRVLVNSDQIVFIKEIFDNHGNSVGTLVILSVVVSSSKSITVREPFEEVKKRLGLTITPRAETIAKI